MSQEEQQKNTKGHKNIQNTVYKGSVTPSRGPKGPVPNSYETYLLQIIEQRPFLPAMEATQLLKDTFKVEAPHARKILERAVKSGFLKSSKPFTFGKGQFVYFSPHRELDRSTVKLLSQAYRPPLYRLIQALEDMSIISYYEGLKITAAPIEPTSSKVDDLSILVRILVEMRLARVAVDEQDVRYIIEEEMFKAIGEVGAKSLMKAHFSSMALDSLFLSDIFRWLTKINLAARRQKPNYRNKNTPSLGVLHNQLVWDGFTYSKTTGINDEVAKFADLPEKQTFVPLDVVISRPYSQIDLDGFLSRIRIYMNSVKKGSRRTMPIVVYREASPQILNTLASLGFLSFDIGIVFGTHIFKVIEQLQIIQLGRNQENKEDWEERIFTALANLRESGQEENLNDLKGILFEFLLYPLLRHLYPSAEIWHGRFLSKIKDGVKIGYEYDYIIRSSNPKELIVVELKGYHGGATIPKGSSDQKSTLNWFFRTTLPFAKTVFATDIENGYQFRGVYITSASFHADGLEMLEELNRGSLKPIALDCFYDGEKLLRLLKSLDFNKALEILQQYYLRFGDEKGNVPTLILEDTQSAPVPPSFQPQSPIRTEEIFK